MPPQNHKQMIWEETSEHVIEKNAYALYCSHDSVKAQDSANAFRNVLCMVNQIKMDAMNK